MKKIIKKITYNTETSELLNSKAFGTFGDPKGYEEKLYITKKGAYFLHCIGGIDSIYPTEQIIPLTDEEKTSWENQL